MFRFDIITLFPDLVRQVGEHGIVRRARERESIALGLWNPRDYTEDPQRRVDDRPYGGGPGMVMQFQPLLTTVEAARAAIGPRPLIYLSPQGIPLDQPTIQRWAEANEGLFLLAGRYEGIDQRFIDTCVDEERSLGDYVLSGGELPAMAIIDAVTRQLPGVLGNAGSAAEDSFSDGLLDCPHYTRPERNAAGGVPEVLLSGDHAAIAEWRRRQAIGRTWLYRPDLLTRRVWDNRDSNRLTRFVTEDL